MANLIIKPTSGGSLILQDEGGTAAHTIDASGNTTLAGTANNLGTISSATFPNGHVVQTVETVYNGGNSSTHASETAAIVVNGSSKHWTGQITNVGASNWVRVTMSFSWNVSISSAATSIGCGFSLFRETTQIMITKNHANYLAGASASWNVYGTNTIDFMDESPATGTNNYYLGYRSTSATHNVVVRSDSDYEPFRCILQEIKK